MKNMLRGEIEKKQTFPGFIRTTDTPISQLSSEQKALLNRQGNVFFNEGDIEGAKRIFVATGYSDGLTRLGDYYFAKHKELDALKFYLLAHNERKSAPLVKKAAELISVLIKE